MKVIPWLASRLALSAGPEVTTIVAAFRTKVAKAAESVTQGSITYSLGRRTIESELELVCLLGAHCSG